MAKTKQIRVDVSLIEVFGNVGRSFAEKIKKEYNLDELYVPHTLASQIIAGRYKGKKMFNFQVNKTGPKKGVLVLVD